MTVSYVDMYHINKCVHPCSVAAVGRLQRMGNPPVQVVRSQHVSREVSSGMSRGMTSTGMSSGMTFGLGGGGGSYSGDSSPYSGAPTSPHYHTVHTQPRYSSPPGYHGYNNSISNSHYPEAQGFSKGGGGMAPNMRYTPSPSPSLQVSACYFSPSQNSFISPMILSQLFPDNQKFMSLIKYAGGCISMV